MTTDTTFEINFTETQIAVVEDVLLADLQLLREKVICLMAKGDSHSIECAHIFALKAQAIEGILAIITEGMGDISASLPYGQLEVPF